MTSTAQFRPAIRPVLLVSDLVVTAWGQSAPRSYYSDLVGEPDSEGQNKADALVITDRKSGGIIRISGNAL